jgi:trans-L-3-hydroxyproline dehydratase
MNNWNPPKNWERITTIDAHAAGEPLRIITGGYPPIPGATMLEKRRFARDNLDHLRTALMWEPRGHADMYGCILTEPVTPDGTLGVLFLHNEGYSTMCGHAVIALTCVLPELGMLDLPENRPVIRYDTPAGRVTATAEWKDGRVERASFRNVPSFVYALDQTVIVPEWGEVSYDIAFGGAFYAFCRAEAFGFKLQPDEFARLIELGMRIKKAVSEAESIRHPYSEDLGFLYGTIFFGPPEDPRNFGRNVCIFADGEVDRSPTGTGVSARAALLFAKEEVDIGEPFTMESILGSCFTGRVVETCRFGSHSAVIPEVSGRGHVTGRHEFLFDPKDRLHRGFILR